MKSLGQGENKSFWELLRSLVEEKGSGKFRSCFDYGSKMYNRKRSLLRGILA